MRSRLMPALTRLMAVVLSMGNAASVNATVDLDFRGRENFQRIARARKAITTFAESP